MPGPRTLLALVLLAVGLAVPSIAWYFAGRRVAEREAKLALEEPRREAERITGKLAAQLGERLESLRARENGRPFYHYQPLYHDPAGASEGPSVTPSPLSRGPDDPLVLAHFDVSGDGRITMPTLGAAPAPAAVVARHRAVARELAPAVPALVAGLPPAVRRVAAPPDRRTAARPDTQAAPPSGRQVETLAQSAYEQNVQASRLYRDIKSKQSGREATIAPPIRDDPRPVSVETSGFDWTTLTLGGAPVLAAARTVRGPDTRELQAFIVDTTEVARLLSVADLPARFAPASGSDGPGRVAAPVGRTGWAVSLDADAPLPAALARGAAIRGRFLRAFALGLLAAGLAGLSVVALVWQAERLARQRSRFAAAAAHELRTPLAGLRMYGEMLAEGLGEPARARDYARTIAAEAERLGRVVANVLGFTRLERGTLRVEPRAGDLATVVRSIVERHRPALEAAGAGVTLEAEPDLPAARFDPDALHQIVHNLLDNAERHTRAAAERRIEVALARAAGGVALTVGDHGPGLPGGSRSRAFRAGGPRRASEAAGLGLGLRMVEALARAQGGAVSYADAAGGGARVSVTFPRA